jgi:phosphomannomutase
MTRNADTTAARQPSLTAGADGWRGIMNEGFSVAAVAHLCTAIGAEVRHRLGGTTVLVAHDGRFYSEEASAAGVEALAAAGLDVVSVGHLPTALVSYALRDGAYAAAVMVTASHNPFYWNGVKLKMAPGMPPPKELERAIEARRSARGLDSVAQGSAGPRGRLTALPAARIEERYAAEVIASLDAEAIRRVRFRVAIDGLHGIAGRFFAELLRSAGCAVELVGGDVDPMFGGLVPDPLESSSRERIADLSRHERAELGFVVDGDGDRLAVLEKGVFIRPHEVLALLLRSLDAKDRSAGDVITTVSTGSLVRLLASDLGRRVRETPIGFKHIAPYLRSGEAILGGGAVGDIGCRGRGYDRDPFFAALLLLETVARAERHLGEELSEIHRTFGHRIYGERSYAGRPRPLAELEALGRAALVDAGHGNEIAEVSTVDGVKIRLADGSWILLRNASTERCLRIYAETTSSDRLGTLMNAAERRATQE